MKTRAKKKAFSGPTTSGAVTALSNIGKRTVLNRRKAPRLTATQNGLVVSNNEFSVSLGQASSADSFAWFGVNPLDSAVFPYLHSIARNYAFYRWKRLRVLYSSNCATTQRGAVVIGSFYDREDLNQWVTSGGARFVTLTQTNPSSMGPVWGSTITWHPTGGEAQIMIDMDVSRMHTRTQWHILNTASDDTAVDNQAIAVYFASATSPSGVPAPCGDIYFDYEIEFLHPKPAFAPAVSQLSFSNGIGRDEGPTYNPFPIPPEPSLPELQKTEKTSGEVEKDAKEMAG